MEGIILMYMLSYWEESVTRSLFATYFKWQQESFFLLFILNNSNHRLATQTGGAKQQRNQKEQDSTPKPWQFSAFAWEV